ncbi:unnamed protein product [Schistosoma curassoni]|uniref:Transposase n=1 Tax=Schistosoma curassoni TaxID=6186 RepID=A0A183JJX5_9TREM|nr:unnamed protein product [Schistosoma curassoni]
MPGVLKILKHRKSIQMSYRRLTPVKLILLELAINYVTVNVITTIHFRKMDQLLTYLLLIV